MKCEACGAPLPAGTARCAYCGTLADLDALATRADPTKQPEHPRPCSGCGQAMDTLNLRDEESPFFIERCPACLGIFLDSGEIDAIIHEKIAQVTTIDRQALMALQEHRAADMVVYRRCPDCGKYMNRVNYGGASGVIIDTCKQHGMYLDAGELRRILAWVSAGGRLAAIESSEAKKPSPLVQSFRDLTDEQDQAAEYGQLAALGRFFARVFK